MKSHHSRGTKHEFVVTFFILSFWNWFHYLTRLFFFNSESYHVGQSPYGFLFIYVVRTLSTGRAGWWNARLALLNYDVLHTTEAAWPEYFFYHSAHCMRKSDVSSFGVPPFFEHSPYLSFICVFSFCKRSVAQRRPGFEWRKRHGFAAVVSTIFVRDFFPSTLAVLIICFSFRFLNVKFCFSINNVKKNASTTYAEQTHELTLFHINCLFVPPPPLFVCRALQLVCVCVSLLKRRLFRFSLSLFVLWERLVFLGLESPQPPTFCVAWMQLLQWVCSFKVTTVICCQWAWLFRVSTAQ